MPGLVIEEEVGLEFLKEWPFLQSAEKHCLIDADIPAHQRSYRSLMGGGASCRDQGRPDFDRAIGCGRQLQLMNRIEQRLEWAGGQGLECLAPLMFRESGQSLALEYTLGLIGEQYRITIEGDSDFMGVPISLDGRLGKYAGCRVASL